MLFEFLFNNGNVIYVVHTFFQIQRWLSGVEKPEHRANDQDILYHLAQGSGSHDLEEMFDDVKVSFMIFTCQKNLHVSFVVRSFHYG
jgi:hypothetical protein